MCWVHVPKHEEDEKLNSSPSFTLAKNNMTMTSNCTIHHRLWVHVPKDEEDKKLRSSSSFRLVKKNIMMISNCTICCHLLVLVLDHEEDDELAYRPLSHLQKPHDNNEQQSYSSSFFGSYSKTR